MFNILKLTNIFREIINYKTINSINESAIKLRNKQLQLVDVFYYIFLYTNKDTTKQHAVSKININNKKYISCQSFYKKEKNISVNVYESLLEKIVSFYDEINNNKISLDRKAVAVDGTYNYNAEYELKLNLGLYDITNKIPVSITLLESDSKKFVSEVDGLINHIQNNIQYYKNVIIVADRLYYNYKLFSFLIDNNIDFVIRAKGEANNLNTDNELKKCNNKNQIEKIRENIRIVKCKSIRDSKFIMTGSKNKIPTNNVIVNMKINTDYTIITNLTDKIKYPDDNILNFYKYRWDIEVFFKYVKNNLKFQTIHEKSKSGQKKIYIIGLIMTYISKIIELDYLKYNPDAKNKNINKTNLMKGIFDSLLHNIMYDELNDECIKGFFKSYVVLYTNKENRSFPRYAKKVYSKWHIKGNLMETKNNLIVDAFIRKDAKKLDKNTKSFIKKILSITIDDKIYENEFNDHG